MNQYADMDNDTLCYRYLPSASQFFQALDGLWILFVVVGGLSCLILYGLFIEQVNFVVNNAHHNFRRHIIWIASIYPFMTLISVVAFSVPRAGAVCNAAKLLYMMIGISNFADLTILMYGSEEVMLWVLKDSSLRFNLQPFFCCCPCLPKLPVTKIKLRTILAGCYQLPFSQAFYSLVVLILKSENQITVGSLNPGGAYLWLNLFMFTMLMLGIYCLNIISDVSGPHLKEYNYDKKSLSLKLLIFTITMQGTIFDILAYYEVFPCKPPISHFVYKETIENAFCIVEMALFGLFSYFLYHKVEFSEPNPTTIPGQARRLLTWDRSNNFYQSTLSNGRNANHGFAYPGDFVDDLVEIGESNFNSGLRDRYDFSSGTLVIDSAGPSSSRGSAAEEVNQQSSIYQTLKAQFGYGRMR